MSCSQRLEVGLDLPGLTRCTILFVPPPRSPQLVDKLRANIDLLLGEHEARSRLVGHAIDENQVAPESRRCAHMREVFNIVSGLSWHLDSTRAAAGTTPNEQLAARAARYICLRHHSRSRCAIFQRGGIDVDLSGVKWTRPSLR